MEEKKPEKDDKKKKYEKGTRLKARVAPYIMEGTLHGKISDDLVIRRIKDKNGRRRLIIQGYTKPEYHPTLSQKKRNAMIGYFRKKINLVAESEIGSWSSLAREWGYTPGRWDVAFLKCNQRRWEAGFSGILLDAPLGIYPPSLGIIDDVIVDYKREEMEIFWRPPDVIVGETHIIIGCKFNVYDRDFKEKWGKCIHSSFTVGIFDMTIRSAKVNSYFYKGKSHPFKNGSYKFFIMATSVYGLSSARQWFEVKWRKPTDDEIEPFSPPSVVGNSKLKE